MEIYDRYQKAMYNIAYRILKDTAAAEDAMQEAFIIAFMKLGDFKGKASFGSWLKRIVINKSLTAYKKAQRIIPIDEYELEDVEEEEREDGVSYKGCKASDLMKGIESLHDSYRLILSLHFIEGYDYEEICEILKITNANCRTLVSRAKESLRKKIAIAS
ncbi:MAG: RNA polymerase sigma factor [Flavobacteriaceae bacterium]|nr:RNA polymerase sigma factor [Flavobacteriaceae bacterium]